MQVVIVSKTQMSNAICVGGVLANGRFVRLLDANGYNQDLDTELEIGNVYSITFSEKVNKTAPHVEDVLVKSLEYKGLYRNVETMINVLKNKLKVKIWKGSIETLFDEKLLWTSGGSGYISKAGGLPKNSVGFWISDKDLIRNDFKDKIRYSYQLGNPFSIGLRKWRNISFVGFQKPVNKIPAGTLIRVSLARWWSPNDDEERCYLQLSGWYGLPEPKERTDDYEDDDLPF